MDQWGKQVILLWSWRNSCHSSRGYSFFRGKALNIISSHRAIILKVSSSQSGTLSCTQFHEVFYLRKKKKRNKPQKPTNKTKIFLHEKNRLQQLVQIPPPKLYAKKGISFWEANLFSLLGLCLHDNHGRESHGAAFYWLDSTCRSLGLLAGGQKPKWTWEKQQGTPGNPRNRIGRKTWRKTNHSLLLPPDKTKKRTWKRSCTAFAALAEISLQSADCSASEEFALGPSSLPPDQNYPPLFSITLSLWKVKYYSEQGCQ